MKALIKTLLLILLPSVVFSQTFYGSTGVIPDDLTQGIFNANVSGLSPGTLNENFGLESVCINVQHNWVADLEIALMAPDSTFILLSSGLGDGGDNYTNTCFNSNSEDPIIKAGAPFTGTFRPLGDLGRVNNGQNGNGTWRLVFLDIWPWSDQGTLLSWSITFSDQPSLPQPFESSSLPIVMINTHGQFIPDDPKMMAYMGIIDNGPGSLNHLGDPFNGYDGYIGIERRGSSSQMFPKKSYGFETWDEEGNDIDVSLFGMPEESDWILNAHYTDKSLMRNVLTYHLSNEMGRYAVRTKFVELFLNDQYWGIYAFMEKIKRDKNRVDISKLGSDDTTGTELTGGYILKIDKTTGSGGEGWTSNYQPPVHPQGQIINFLYEYPEFDDLQQQQIDYIQAYVDTFETALYNYGDRDDLNYLDYADIGSFADYFILNELSKNVDGYRLSTFFHKDKEGKINMGPVWDYDIAWHNADYCAALYPEGWAYEFGNVCPDDYWQVPFWWGKLLTDTIFTKTLRCRWDDLRMTTLSDNYLMNYIDAVADTLDGAQQRNFIQWPILGYWVWPNPYPLAQTYEEEVEALKSWILLRLDWLDENIPGECNSMVSPEITIPGISIYPNPARDILFIEFNKAYQKDITVDLTDPSGRREAFNRYSSGESLLFMDVSALPEGLYLLKITTDEGSVTRKIIKI